MFKPFYTESVHFVFSLYKSQRLTYFPETRYTESAGEYFVYV